MHDCKSNLVWMSVLVCSCSTVMKGKQGYAHGSKVLLCLYPLFCRGLIASIDCDVLYVVLVFKIRGEVKRCWS